MSPDDKTSIVDAAKKVLDGNARDGYTAPGAGLYPHQWLWDSCFVAIGLSHYDPERAQKEILHLLKSQWHNGMIPHMVLDEGLAHRADREFWRSYVSYDSPDKVATSGITQPPMLAEAIVRIGARLKKAERRSWFLKVYKQLVAYHQWLYNERDPHQEGLTLQVHPWETGMDNTPPWMSELHSHQQNWWIRLVAKLRLDSVVTIFRRDRHLALPGERLSSIDALALYAVQHRLRRKQYNIDKIISHSMLSIEDLAFNSILVRANQHLKDIAKEIREELPEELLQSINKTEAALDQLWDPYTGQYYSRNFASHDLIKISTIATFLPLYAGSITKERADQLAGLLKTSKRFHPRFPVPTVPTDSKYFNEHRYWQGPVWMNMNWLIIDGLERYGHKELAAKLKEKSLEMVEKSGFCEYFSPHDGSGAGVKNFSWTAALTIDLLSN